MTSQIAHQINTPLATLGLNTSKRGDYALPLPKRYTGFAEKFGW